MRGVSGAGSVIRVVGCRYACDDRVIAIEVGDVRDTARLSRLRMSAADFRLGFNGPHDCSWGECDRNWAELSRRLLIGWTVDGPAAVSRGGSATTGIIAPSGLGWPQVA